jgi:hypothetical protein
LTDDQLNARTRKEQSSADRAERAEESRVAAYAQSRVDQSRRNNHNSTDDASPLVSSQPAPARSGSTWDRIRQESASSKGSPRQSPTNTPQIRREQQEGSTLGDSFSFASSDEERQLAKTEAQKEFDARVERERQGGDFAETGAKGGWRK